MKKTPPVKTSVCLTLLIQKDLELKNNKLKTFEVARDKVIAKLEKQGWSVNVEDEGDAPLDDNE